MQKRFNFNDLIELRIIKFVNIYIVPIIVGTIVSMFFEGNIKFDTSDIIKIILGIALCLWYIITSWKYYVIEKETKKKLEEIGIDLVEKNKENEVLETKNKSYEKVLLSLTTLFNTSAEAINGIAQKIYKVILS